MTLHAPAPLAEHHILDRFDSGTPSLDDWLKRRARANQVSGARRCFAVADDARVIAYYALASGSITHAEATSSLRRNMPAPVPVVTLARLAVDRSYQRSGLGRDLIQDAAKRVIAAADQIGIRGMIVHAISEEAKTYYLRHGLHQSPTNEMTLMISLAELKANL